MDAHRLAHAIRALRLSVQPCSSLVMETRTSDGSRYMFLTHGGGYGVNKLRDVEPQPGARYWLHATSQKRRCSNHTEITAMLIATPTGENHANPDQAGIRQA